VGSVTVGKATTSEIGGAIRIASAGHVVFAAAMIGLGIMGFVRRDFAQIWQPVPKWVPARTALVYLTALISLGSGVGLLLRRWAPAASRLVFASLSVWLLVLRLPNLFYEHPLVLVAWTFGATAVMVAGAWVLSIWFADESDRSRFGFLTQGKGLRVARALFGVSLIPFGLAHFMYLDATTVLIPAWLPWHVAWAYFTGAAFIAAGLAVAVGVLSRFAAALVTLEIGLFGLIVWLPRLITGNVTAFQRGEFISGCALMAGAWVVADSYRVTPRPR
jgi:uncharacterized membrane protein